MRSTNGLYMSVGFTSSVALHNKRSMCLGAEQLEKVLMVICDSVILKEQVQSEA